ncbi:6-phosphogluconolactonase [Massilibacteroides vaginae]|uniref:6-phosphogluconolactonase n=1 Tax=Massilibacteroides vaginae TaxID=1673718 RepID=UPI000A1C825F|nr:6-phosphogluconolactonase [Massilibacteroides vaginae]
MKTEKHTTGQEALRALTAHLIALMEAKAERRFNLALSGGETAKQMYDLWVSEYEDTLDWGRLHFYWVDERCVAPDSPDSNYGHARRLLFEPLNIAGKHIHRIQGENEPEGEAVRYAAEVEGAVSINNGKPRFDCIILGVGNDLHTASIFPHTMPLLTDPRSYATAAHPESGQIRVTMTGPVILNDTPLLVPVLGSGKSAVISALEESDYTKHPTPAIYVVSKATDVTLYTEYL